MFKFKLEEELQNHILENFGDFYEFDLIGNEITIENGRIDILGKDNDNIYVVELKRAEITVESIEQVSSYLPYVQERHPNKNIIGIVSAPNINRKVDLSKIPDNIRLKILKNVQCVVKTNHQLTERKPLSNAVKIELYDALKQLSEETKVPISKLLDEAIEDLLTKRNPKN